jgi:glycosyltransferase involved in cell wall biosynthesis
MEITVIIPTYNRVDSLQQTLQALQKQTFAEHRFEVIVVNDGSTDGTEAYLNKVALTFPNFRFFNQKNAGPAAARNRGIYAAQGKIIAFTDDDCIPQNNWLEVIIHAFKENNGVGLQGSTYTDKQDITPLTHQIDNENGNASVPTCNAAFTKEALVQINGFDEHFPYPHNEDADLAWRIEKLGSIAFVKNMCVYHPPRLDSFNKVAKRMKIMESEFRLFYRNPLAYQQKRASSPWKNIYWELGIKTQVYYLLSRVKYYRQPLLMLQGFALTFLWWYDLMIRLPRFIHQAKKERKEFPLSLQ